MESDFKSSFGIMLKSSDRAKLLTHTREDDRRSANVFEVKIIRGIS